MMERDHPLDAPTALDVVVRARARVADRLITPWWYHLLLGVLVAQHVLVQGLENRNWTLPSAIVLVIGCFALVVAYRRLTGLSVVGPTGPRSRRLLAVMVVVVLACVVLAATAGRLWVGAGAAAVVLVANIVLGRRYDEMLRQDLRDADGGRQ